MEATIVVAYVWRRLLHVVVPVVVIEGRSSGVAGTVDMLVADIAAAAAAAVVMVGIVVVVVAFLKYTF